MPDGTFNPLDKLHLAESLAEAVLKRPLGPLPPQESFSGAGIYAIYYHGAFPPYKPLKKINEGDDNPVIYVGKAVPAGARKGGFGLGINPGTVLLKRLREHARSIREVQNLIRRTLLVATSSVMTYGFLLVRRF